MASYQKSPSERSDLTDGSVWKGILKFALPLLAGSLFQQLYTTADGIIVGRFAGASALAAIDGVYSLTKLPVNFLTGLSSGATVLLAQYFGARETEKIRQGAHAAFVLALIGGSLLGHPGGWAGALVRPDDSGAGRYLPAVPDICTALFRRPGVRHALQHGRGGFSCGGGFANAFFTFCLPSNWPISCWMWSSWACFAGA